MIDIYKLITEPVSNGPYRRMICPTTTSYLELPFLEKNPKFIPLKKAYEKEVSMFNEHKVLLSLLNAVLSQDITFFCFSRRTLSKIVLNDKNFENPYFSPSAYNKYLKHFFECGISRLVPAQINKKKSGIYYINDSSEFRSMLSKNLDGQIEEALEFAKPFWDRIEDKDLVVNYKDRFIDGLYTSKKDLLIKETDILNKNLNNDQKIKEIKKEKSLISFENYPIDKIFN